jgi:predicted nucleic acid-binding Zn ribbon protein
MLLLGKMPTYIYETTDAAKPKRRFEVVQKMGDAALCADPATGEPVRRVISGGYGILVTGKFRGPLVGSVGSHDVGDL